jgi:hypothetical protein
MTHRINRDYFRVKNKHAGKKIVEFSVRYSPVLKYYLDEPHAAKGHEKILVL